MLEKAQKRPKPGKRSRSKVQKPRKASEEAPMPKKGWKRPRIRSLQRSEKPRCKRVRVGPGGSKNKTTETKKIALWGRPLGETISADLVRAPAALANPKP